MSNRTQNSFILSIRRVSVTKRLIEKDLVGSDCQMLKWDFFGHLNPKSGFITATSLL